MIGVWEIVGIMTGASLACAGASMALGVMLGTFLKETSGGCFPWLASCLIFGIGITLGVYTAAMILQ